MYTITDLYNHFGDIHNDYYTDIYKADNLQSAMQIIINIEHIQGTSYIYLEYKNKVIVILEKNYI